MEERLKVKIGDTIHDSDMEPLMVILSEADKANIAQMTPEYTKYAAFPDWFSKQANKWMGVNDED